MISFSLHFPFPFRSLILWALFFFLYYEPKEEIERKGNLLVGSSPSSTRHIKEKENVQTCDHTCVFFLSFSRVGRSKTLRRLHSSWWWMRWAVNHAAADWRAIKPPLTLSFFSLDGLLKSFCPSKEMRACRPH